MTVLSGIVLLAAAIGVSAWLLYRLARLGRGGGLVEALAHTTFLPEKRQRFLLLLSLEGSSLLLAAISWSLGEAGVVSSEIADLLLVGFLAAGMICVAAVTELGLRPGRLSDAEREEIRRRAPEVFRSLAFLPTPAMNEPEAPG